MEADAVRRGRFFGSVRAAAAAEACPQRQDSHTDKKQHKQLVAYADVEADAMATTSPAVEQERARQEALHQEPVVLRLMHISKSYRIAGTSDKVHALMDITLCEPDRLLLTEPCDEDNGEAAVAAATTAAAAGAAATTTTERAAYDNGKVYCSDACRAELDARARLPFAPLHRGEFVMIRGPSGGGKTTLLNIIGLIDTSSDGVMELNGRRITNAMRETTLADIRLRNIGFVFQTFNLIPTMTAAENVELPMTLLSKLSRRAMRLRARQLLTLVGLRNRVNHLPSELSGGEQQRVTIARSLANNPSMLLLDEPTGDLDTVNTIEIMDLLLRINRHTHTTCIMVTHNPDIECYADRILYVSDGRFVKEVHNARPMRLDVKRYTAYLEAEEQRLMQASHDDDNDDNGGAAAAAATATATATAANDADVGEAAAERHVRGDEDGNQHTPEQDKLCSNRSNSEKATPMSDALGTQSTLPHPLSEHTSRNNSSGNSEAATTPNAT